jgi:hypothetical protein
MTRRLLLALLLLAAGYCRAEEPKAPAPDAPKPAADRGPEFAASHLHFATAEEAGNFLAEEDEYFRALGPMHRGLILKNAGDVSLDELKKHVKACGRDWTDEEKTAFTGAFAKFAPKVADLKLHLPAEILLIKTNGDEDIGMPYTRRNAIVFPQGVVERARGMRLVQICAHELFHVFSRLNPELRDAIYALFGFEPVVNPPKPETWEKLRITNPDAPVSRHALRVKIADGTEVKAVPYLLSKKEAYDARSGKNAFAYLDVVWLEISNKADTKARTFTIRDFTDFNDRTGGNTEYIIHPEEISADNFMLMILGAPKVATPGKLTDLEALLRKAAK